MQTNILLGIQWGDEGKGRIVDYYAGDYDVVARFGGGDNAGHTLVVGDRKIALRIVPSGVLQERPELFIGGGTVVGLTGLLAEIDMLASLGVDITRIKVSDRAHIVFAYHAALDRANELARGNAAIGTTGRGIGPAYTDKVARIGITFADLRVRERLVEKVKTAYAAHAARLATLDDVPSEAETLEQTLLAAERLSPHIVDGVEYIHAKREAGKALLIEGAQGSLLDIGYGTYPFVTSSPTIAGGACVGLGLGPTQIDRVTGIAKAYCTRVGSGPFASELHDELGERLRRQGKEFGTVTGRSRRCGWFDAVAARYAVRLNGCTDSIITKLDVLSGFERIGIVTDYRIDDRSVSVGAMDDPRLTPTIEWHDGWNDDLSDIRRIDDLPDAPRRYVARLAELLRVPIVGVSLGPERSAFACS